MKIDWKLMENRRHGLVRKKFVEKIPNWMGETLLVNHIVNTWRFNIARKQNTGNSLGILVEHLPKYDLIETVKSVDKWKNQNYLDYLK